MESNAEDARFVGSVPELYARLLVPMIFAEAADRLAGQIAACSPSDVLETAAGTGVLTRAIAARCPEARITATDLNQPMLDVASSLTPDAGQITWQQADAQDLPVGDESFDVVACQFGVMFFPDKIGAFAEARRVLRGAGAFIFNTWDRIEANEIADTIQGALVGASPDQALMFMSRAPHGYHDRDQIRSELTEAGFADIEIEAVDALSRTTAADAAVAFCQGTPLRGFIEAHPSLDLQTATQIAHDALLERYGPGPIAAAIRSLSIVATAAPVGVDWNGGV